MAFFQPLEHTQRTYEKQTSIEFLLDNSSSQKESSLYSDKNEAPDTHIKRNSRIELPSPSSFCSEPLIYDNSYPSSNFSQTHDKYHKYHKKGVHNSSTENLVKSPMEIQYLKRIKALMVLVDRQTKEIKYLREALEAEKSRKFDEIA